MEVAGKSRCHGMQLEGMAYPITPIGMHYLLIHYDIPMLDDSTYRLQVDGLVKNTLALDMDNIRGRPKVTIPATMECCGNGRASQRGACGRTCRGTTTRSALRSGQVRRCVGCLRRPESTMTRWRSRSPAWPTGLQGPPDAAEVQHFQRSLSVEYAMDPANDVLLCYEINGFPLPPQHGFPLRLLVPGWLGMANVKWLGSIEAIDWRLSKNQMKWYSYASSDNDPNRIPATFQQVRAMMIPPGSDFLCRIRHLEETDAVELRGRAWAGGLRITEVEVSLDGGETWSFAKLDNAAVGKWAWICWLFSWEDVTRVSTRCGVVPKTNAAACRNPTTTCMTTTRWTTPSRSASMSTSIRRAP